MNLRLTYDQDSDAAYVRFAEGAVADSEEVSPGIVLDFDADGRVLAIEMLQASNRLPADALSSAWTKTHPPT